MSYASDYEWDQGPMEMVEIGYEDYLNSLFEQVNDDGTEEIADTESGMSFCGCDTCCTRETFAYLMPKFIELFEQGYIRKAQPDDSSA